MLTDSRGIVLNTLRYSDSSVIAQIYTETAGLRSFMVRTGKGKRALSKLGLLQPLSLIALSYVDDDRKGLLSARSVERSKVLNAIPFDTVKTCIALFMAEVVARSIGEKEQNMRLFKFLWGAVIRLDRTEQHVSNYHLKFMLDFSKHLGFYPQERIAGQTFFDLMEGGFSLSRPVHPHILEPEQADLLSELLTLKPDESLRTSLTASERRTLLQALIDYYRLHLQGMKEITSHKVLEEVLG